jgi:hypothetical protein
MSTEILIAVFEGDPLDAVELRNAAIHIKYEDGEKRLYHLPGTIRSSSSRQKSVGLRR